MSDFGFEDYLNAYGDLFDMDSGIGYSPQDLYGDGEYREIEATENFAERLVEENLATEDEANGYLAYQAQYAASSWLAAMLARLRGLHLSTLAMFIAPLVGAASAKKPTKSTPTAHSTPSSSGVLRAGKHTVNILQNLPRATLASSPAERHDGGYATTATVQTVAGPGDLSLGRLYAQTVWLTAVPRVHVERLGHADVETRRSVLLFRSALAAAKYTATITAFTSSSVRNALWWGYVRTALKKKIRWKKGVHTPNWHGAAQDARNGCVRPVGRERMRGVA
ncbi:hypothetical protein HYDPIDRAFT_29770 [Hydnomerulius pinastri MD-312]|uniref:Uncharacterized protein n=1 Tax=Hydnomerulius pinastri MD-312 TaxID=994086 RepID=A0A0C9W7D1_9AGAM|nr:hypothetical protein HYDPIDRAFT_29770 [Hydnomerulius pinastri MD-312]